MGAYFFCGGINLFVAFLQMVVDDTSSNPWLTIVRVFSLCGKFGISGAYAVLYLFTTEQFPTVTKNSGLGMCSLCARIGGIL